MIDTYRFYKNSFNKWYIDLPAWEGNVEELEMVEGADKFLDLVSNHGENCHIIMSDEALVDGEVLELVYSRTPEEGEGGDYVLKTYLTEYVGHKLWLCKVTEFVFGWLPDRIYFKKKVLGDKE